MTTERFSCIHFYHVFIFITNYMIISNITLEIIDSLLVSRAFQLSPLERRAMSPNLQITK